ncbi:MAG: DNA polymerase III subunit alpha [Deltaproteobacteria bacterium]|nr:DNA polymerase III subunit alpha [Deltaproteobacteria bacterium]
MSFVHLHLHTQFSLLDGANKIKNLMPQVEKHGMPAVAMTDHGNMFGAIEFYRTAAQHGVKPIVGCEVYVAPKSRLDHSGGSGADEHEHGGNFHLILLAMNLDGYRNLCRLVSAGFTDGFYRKPRIDKELMREHNTGIIALSGCLSGEVARAMLVGKEHLARQAAEEYAAIFDDRFYIEIQANHLPEQEKINPALIELSRQLALPLVATNDCHYLKAEDAEAHEVLLCVQSGKVWSDEKRWRFGTNQLYVKSPEEMLAEFSHCPEAIANTVEVASRCNLELSFGNFLFPVYDVPKKETLEEALKKKARAGLEERFEQIRAYTPEWNAEKEQEYYDRLEFELQVIEKMGFSGYFLIVSDFIGYAKSQGIPVGPGRGSAAGCLVAYSTKITDVDPIRYQLLFERFLNPGRKSMPDIDVDFCFERRDEVIRYIKEKYGSDKVAQIITFGTLKGKQAIKDVGRVLEFSYGDTDRIAKLYPAPKQGKDFPLEAAMEMEPRLRELRDKGDKEKKLFDYALKLEGLLRHASKHAAGIVISPAPLVEHIPLFVDKEGNVLTQYSGPDVDTIGLIKFDFLGLKTLTLLDDTVKRIKKSRGVDVDLSTLRIDDKKTYQDLTRGETVGVFQMEGSGIRKLITQLKPSSFEDIIAVIALFRPGPLDSGAAEQFIKRKHGKEQISYSHKLLEPVLKETYGVTIYQEQVMQIAQVLAGYSLEDADNLRRAMGKKKKEVMQEERARFLKGTTNQKIPEKLAGEIFDQMETFAAYGFNKSHAAAYALISYQTAYLKSHYPQEFMAALMSLEMGDTNKTYKNIAECRLQDIPVLPPDVHESDEGFTVSGETIRFGLGAVKGIGSKAIEAMQVARQDGPFTDLHEFCSRVRGSQVNKRVLESLVKCGALDSFKVSRAQLFAEIEPAMKKADQEAKGESNANQLGLFASLPTKNGNGRAELPKIEEWSDTDKLKNERETLGFFITGHPLDKYVGRLHGVVSLTTESLGTRQHQEKVKLAGVVHSLKLKNNKKGDRYATFTLEDKEGVVEVIVWPEAYRQHEATIHADQPVCLSGTLDVDEDRCQVIANEVVPLESVATNEVKQVHIQVPADVATREDMVALKDVLQQHLGNCQTYLHLLRPDYTETIIALPQDLSVAPTRAMLVAVERLFGSGVASFR